MSLRFFSKESSSTHRFLSSMSRRERCLPFRFTMALTSYTRDLDSQLPVSKYSTRVIAHGELLLRLRCLPTHRFYRRSSIVITFCPNFTWIKIYGARTRCGKTSFHHSIYRFPNKYPDKNILPSQIRYSNNILGGNFTRVHMHYNISFPLTSRIKWHFSSHVREWKRWST